MNDPVAPGDEGPITPPLLPDPRQTPPPAEGGQGPPTQPASEWGAFDTGYDAANEGDSKRGLYVFVGIMAVGLVGMLWWALRPGPSAADAESGPIMKDWAAMSNDDLAKDAGVGAAKELAVRIVRGDPVTAADARSAVQHNNSVRLARNLAHMLALEQQKKQQETMLEMERVERGGWQ